MLMPGLFRRGWYHAQSQRQPIFRQPPGPAQLAVRMRREPSCSIQHQDRIARAQPGRRYEARALVQPGR